MQTSLDLSRATHRAPVGPTVEGLSSATFERVVLDGEPYVVKRLSHDTDWVMRMTHDVGVPRVVRMHTSGLFDRLPASLDTTLVDVAFDPETGVAELLMRDVGPAFLRDSEPFSSHQHEVFLDTMAQLHASTQDMVDDLGLTTPAQRWSFFRPSAVRAEERRAPLEGVLAVVLGCWHRLADAAPETHRVLRALVDEPAPLVRALATTPTALVHGDWKGGNLGITDDAKVVLVDWAFPGVDAPCADLGWYLAVNCDRLPETKASAIERYRDALERHGLRTAGWWDRQLALALLGTAMQMAWSKCDQPEELAWWSARVEAAAPLL
jgi:hypothetical protein